MKWTAQGQALLLVPPTFSSFWRFISFCSLRTAAVSVGAVNSFHGRHVELVADGRLRASDKIAGEGVGKPLPRKLSLALSQPSATITKCLAHPKAGSQHKQRFLFASCNGRKSTLNNFVSRFNLRAWSFVEFRFIKLNLNVTHRKYRRARNVNNKFCLPMGGGPDGFGALS